MCDLDDLTSFDKLYWQECYGCGRPLSPEYCAQRPRPPYCSRCITFKATIRIEGRKKQEAQRTVQRTLDDGQFAILLGRTCPLKGRGAPRLMVRIASKAELDDITSMRRKLGMPAKFENGRWRWADGQTQLPEKAEGEDKC